MPGKFVFTVIASTDCDNIMAVDGFSLLRRDRKGRRGVGVAVYVGDKYDNAVLHCSGDDELFELLWVSVRSDNTNVVGTLYHPPSPIYQTSALLDYIENSVGEINTKFPQAAVILAGNLNALSDTEIASCTSLISIVDQLTRCNSYLDRIYVSDIFYEHTMIVTSTVKSDHKAIVAYTGDVKQANRKDRTVVKYRKRSPTLMLCF